MKQELSDWYIQIKQCIYERKLNRKEKMLRKWKPDLINKWHSDLEDKIRQEFEEELDLRDGEITILKQNLLTMTQDKELYQHKYEASMEFQESLINKVEKTSTKTGELKTTVKQLNDEIKELQSEDEEQSKD